MTRMPACFRFPFQIHPDTQRWHFCTDLYFLALARRNPPAIRAGRVVDLDRESIWISYCSLALEGSGLDRFGQFTSHHRLATPVSPWERLKIGGGTPPILTRHGWLIVYHGVRDLAAPNSVM